MQPKDRAAEQNVDAGLNRASQELHLSFTSLAYPVNTFTAFLEEYFIASGLVVNLGTSVTTTPTKVPKGNR